MKSTHAFLATTLTVVLAISSLGATAHAETIVNLSNMHLCCGACVKGVTSAIDSVDGASVKVQQDANSATITAGDAATAQKALDALAAAGFHGKSDSKEVKMKDNSGVKAGKVQRLELVGVHNCCGGCNKAVKAAIASVDGVVADTAKAKSDTVVIEGDFDGQAVVKALLKAGFHVTAKK
ncbi:MAG: heavy-metal-associated domain-containing protein [Planctomycetaceae bacterium]|nr:heavy-metal-associated domain-containing protein [Planctomycetales bacterium]MCB9941138.1 heavy-metal-associated domain-containing protein [Planctomycetaceae bacterium]